MRETYIEHEQEYGAFAKKAAEYFKANARCYTYADGDPTPGQLFAIRWNPFAVLVVRLDVNFEPLCYPTSQFFPGDLPPLKGEPQAA